MSVAVETARDEANGWRMYLLALYYLISGNVSLSIAGLGVAIIGLGVVLEDVLAVVNVQSDNVPVYAGMFGVWGASLVALGLLMYLALFANAKYADLVAS